MEEIALTSVGMLKKIGHPSFKFFESKLRAEVSYRSMLYWHTMKGLPDNEVIEFMKEVAEFLEMNDLAWRELMHLFHDIRPGRAKLALWKLFETAAKMEHVNIFKSTTAIIGDSKDLKIGSNSKQIKMSPDDMYEQTPSGVKIKSAWQVLKEHHTKRGPQGSAAPHKYILMQEERIRDLKLAFETDWSTQQIPEDRSRASAPTQTSSSSSLAGQGSSYSVVGQDDPRP